MPTINVSDFLGGSFVGFNGSRGFTGSRAYTGSRGFMGSQGYNGSQGYTGSQGIFGYTGSRGAMNWSLKTSNYQLQNLEAIISDTSGGSFTVYLPQSPTVGSIVEITDGANWEINPLTVSRNLVSLETIEGFTDNFILDITGIRVEFIYDGNTWQVLTNIGKKGDTGPKGGFADWVYLTQSNNNYVASDLQALIANTNTGSFTIKLPPSPVIGDVISIVDGGNWSLNPLTIDRNTNTIEGVSQNYTADIQGIRLEFIYDGTTWQIVNSRGPSGELGYTGSRGFRGSVGYAGSRGMKADVSITTPTGPNVVSGHMWFDPYDASLSVYYDDGNSSQWVVTSGPPGPQGIFGFTGSKGMTGYYGSKGYSGSKGLTGTIANTSEVTPANPVNGQIWFDPNDASLSVFYSDIDGGQWVVTSGSQGPQGNTGKTISDVVTTSVSPITPIVGDETKLYACNSINTTVFTLPNHSTQPFAIGTTFVVTRYSTGAVQITAAAGVSLYRKTATNPVAISSQFGVVTITKLSNNIWLIHGDLA